MEYTLRSIHGLIHDVCPQLIFQQTAYQIRIEWLIFYQAARLEWIIQGHSLWHLRHIPLHAFQRQVQFDFWKCYYKWSEIDENKAWIRWKRILSLCTPNVFFVISLCLCVCLHIHVLLWERFGEFEGYVHVSIDDFLCWPAVCDEKWEMAVSEVTHWLLVSTRGQMTLKCFVYTSTATTQPSIVKPKDEKLRSL